MENKDVEVKILDKWRVCTDDEYFLYEIYEDGALKYKGYHYEYNAYYADFTDKEILECVLEAYKENKLNKPSLRNIGRFMQVLFDMALHSENSSVMYTYNNIEYLEITKEEILELIEDKEKYNVDSVDIYVTNEDELENLSYYDDNLVEIFEYLVTYFDLVDYEEM